MPIDLIIPEVGESITEVEIGQVMAPQGTQVSKDDPILEIETDKVTLELPAPADGVVGELKVKQGDAARVGDVIGSLSEGDAKSQAQADSSAVGDQPATATTTASQAASEEPTSGGDEGGGPARSETDQPQHANGHATDATVMPAARRLLDEHNLDASNIKPTGPGGRLLKEDVQNYLEKNGQGTGDRTVARAVVDEPATRTVAVEGAGQPAAGGREEQSVRMTPLRRKIAANLVKAQQTAALLTTFNEVDMSAVMALRKQYQDQFLKKYDIKLGFMSFFVKAVIDALKAYPAVNAEVKGEGAGDTVLYKNYYDIGIAVGGGKGLVVPVIRDADRLSFAQVEQKIADLGKRAKDGKLDLAELQGGTFTITNGGIYGSMLSTPIINPPQSGVLGMHNIVKRAVVNPRTDAIEARPMMYLALSYDHRIVDGREAVSFLVQVKQNIEDPTRMLVEV